MRKLVALAILAVAFAAQADSVTNEVIVSSTQATDANPRSGVFTDALNAAFDVGEDWTISAGAMLTLQGATPAGTRAQFGESGSAVTLFTGGLDWSATDHLTLGATLEISPKSTQYAGTTIPLLLSGTIVTPEAQLRSQTSEVGGGLDVSWDSFGESDLEWSFDAGIGFSHYNVDQGISAVRTTLDAQQLQQAALAYCNAFPRSRACARGLLQPVTLDFERFSGGATARLFRDTDVSLLFDWYLYNQDPADVGFGSQAFLGRGAGLPIAPLQYLVRPEVLHRFGDFSAKLWGQAGEYASGTGQGTAGLGARLQYKFTKAFRAWLMASGQRDVDADGRVTRSGTISAGAGYRW